MSSAHKLIPLRRRDSEPSPLLGGRGGFVTRALEDGSFEIRIGQDTERARQAPSCLLVPEIGDEVWLLSRATRGPVIAAVVGRDEPRTGVVALPGPAAELRAEGDLRVRSERGLELEAREAVRVKGATLELKALRTRIATEALEVFATHIDAGMDKARLVAKRIDAAFDSIATRVKQSLRWVEELEQVRAGLIDYRAKGNVHVHGGSAFVSADRVVQVRGEEIHLS